MLDLGTLRLGIKVDSDAAKSELNSVGGEVEGVGGKTEGLASKAKTMIKAFAAAWAVKELIKLGKAALDAYAQFEQLEGGVKKIFGDEATDLVMKNAERAYKTAGLSANKYMEQVTSFSASLIQSLDGDTVKAAEVADMAIQDMADNANTFGTDIQSIQNAYQGFAKGNFTMLDNLKLGFAGSKEGMQQLLDKAEEVTGKKYDISNLNDIYEAIHVMQEEMNIAGTTSKEAATTIEGSTGMMKASWENLLTAIGSGEGVGEATTNFLDSIGTMAKNIAPVAWKILEGLAKGFVDAVPRVIGQIGDFMSTLADKMTETGSKGMARTSADIIIKFVSGLIKNIPKLVVGAAKLIVALVKALIEGIPEMIRAGKEALEGFISGFLDGHPKIAKAVETIGKVFDTILKPVKIVIEGVTKAWKKLIGSKKEKKFSVKAPFKKAIGAIGDVYSKWKDVQKQAVSKTFEVIKKGFKGVLEGMKSIYNKWKDILGQKSKKTFTVENKTKGGKDGPGQRIGLREVPYDGYAVTLHKGETVLTAAETNRYEAMLNSGRGLSGGGDTFNVNVYGSNNMNVQDLASAVERKLIQMQKRRTLAWQ